MRNPTPRRATAGLALAALAAALTVTACGNDDGGSESLAPAKLAIEVTEQGKDKFRVSAPDSVESGLVDISLTAPAGEATHDAQLVRVEGEHTVDEVVAAVAANRGGPIPPWLIPAGGVGQTDGGAVNSVVQQLEPGQYYILDVDEPEGDNVSSYAEMGATAALEVTGEATAAELPETDAKVTASDYRFEVSGLKAGTNRVEFENTGEQPHHLIAFPYNRGATLDDAKQFFSEEGEPSGPPPLDFAGVATTAVLEGGDRQIAELELTRGKYALICFVSDREGEPPHVAMGMIVEATVE